MVAFVPYLRGQMCHLDECELGGKQKETLVIGFAHAEVDGQPENCYCYLPRERETSKRARVRETEREQTTKTSQFCMRKLVRQRNTPQAEHPRRL